MIELGDLVKDKISGLQGIVIGMTQWLYGCDRVVIQPRESKDGKPAEGFNIDLPQAELVEKHVVVDTRRRPPVKKPGGPRNDALGNKRN